jgi:hypothetical protein
MYFSFKQKYVFLLEARVFFKQKLNKTKIIISKNFQ